MMSETITIRDDEGGQVTDKPEETEPPTAAARTDSEEVLVGDLSPDRTKSPESCSICLGKLENKSFTDSCFHTFCFTCLQEWSKVKAVCPLCKQDFKSIIHNVRSIEDYDQYDLRSNNDDGADDNRFRYRTTLTPDRWMQRQRREQSRQLRMLERPSAIGTRAQWHRMRQTATSDFRRQVYTNGDRVQDFPQTPGRPRRERNISPEFLRQNPACSHRLVPWLNRELNVLLHNHEDHVQFVLELIIDLITRYEIGDEVFRTHLDSFLGRRTDHFVHEFIHFARSPYDMCTYDARAVYQVNSDSVDPSTVLSVDSSSNSDVNNDDSDIIVLSPTEDGQSGGDHSYYSRGFNNEPLEERRDAGNIASTPNPLIERVRDFLASVDLADTAHSGWESPLPGPSTLDWSPPNPASPTLEAKEQQSAAEESDDIQEIKATPATVVPIIEQGAEMNQSNNASDDDVEVMITAFDKPYLERSPSPIDISSEEDLDVLIAIANSKRTKIEDDNRRNKSQARRSRTPAQYRIKSKSRSRSHSRRRSRSRNSSRSYSRRRSRSRSRYRSSRSRERSRYERGKRHGRSRSIERRSRYSRSRSRGRYDYGGRSRSGSRNNDRYGGSRGSKYDRRSRSMSPRRWRRSVSSSRSYRHEGSSRRWRRSRSSSIEYIGWKGGKDRHDGRRGDKRRDRRENRKRRRSGDSIEILERSSRDRGDSSRRRNRSHSRSRRSDRDDASYKKHPSGHKKSSNVTNKINKEESIPLPVPVNMIKLEPVSWQIDGPFPVLFTESNDNLCVAGDASNSTVADSSATTGVAKNSVSAAEHKASTQSDCSQKSSERDKQASLNTTIEISQTSLMKTTIGGSQLSSLENVCQKSSGSRKDRQNSSSTRKDSYNSSNSRKDSHCLLSSRKDSHSSSSSRKDSHSSSSSRKNGHNSSSSRKNGHNSSSSRKNGHNSSSSRKDNQNSSSGSTRHKQNSSTKGEHKLSCLTKDGQGSSGSSKSELKSAKDGQQTSNYAKDGQRPSNSSEYRKTSSSSVKNAHGSSTPKKDGQASKGSLTKNGQSSGQSSSSSRKDSFQSTLSSTGGLKNSSSKSSTCKTDSKRCVAKEGAQQSLLVSGGKSAEVQKPVRPCEDRGNLDRSQSGSAASVNTAPCNSDGMGLETGCHSLRPLGKSRVCGCDNNSCELHINQASTNLDVFSNVLTAAVDLNQLEKQMREKLTNRLKSVNDGHCMDSL